MALSIKADLSFPLMVKSPALVYDCISGKTNLKGRNDTSDRHEHFLLHCRHLPPSAYLPGEELRSPVQNSPQDWHDVFWDVGPRGLASGIGQRYGGVHGRRVGVVVRIDAILFV